VVNSDGTGARKLVNSVYLSGAGIQWSPNGKYVMDSDRQGNLRIVDVNKGEAVIISPSRFGNVSGASKEFTQVSWSPDGKTILVGIIVINNVTEETIGKELYLISVDGTRIERLDIPGLGRHFPIWLGADELLFRDSRRGSIWNKAILRRAEQ
jgi:tricorn protease-like protein